MKLYSKSFIENEEIKKAVKRRCFPRSYDESTVEKVREDFKTVCEDISKYLGSEFKGSLDEIYDFDYTETESSEDKIKKLELLVRILIVNLKLVYESEKIGIYQPDLWYKVWDKNEIKEEEV